MTNQTKSLEDLETRLTARVAEIDEKVSDLALQSLEFRGFAKGLIITTPIAIGISLLIAGFNYWLLCNWLPPR